MIPIRKIDEELLQVVRLVKRGTTLFELLAAYFISVLEKNNGNRTHTAEELKIPIRTVRNRIWEMQALGYRVPEPTTTKVVYTRAKAVRKKFLKKTKRKTKLTEF